VFFGVKSNKKIKKIKKNKKQEKENGEQSAGYKEQIQIITNKEQRANCGK